MSILWFFFVRGCWCILVFIGLIDIVFIVISRLWGFGLGCFSWMFFRVWMFLMVWGWLKLMVFIGFLWEYECYWGFK